MLYVIGIGAGNAENMTCEAVSAIEKSDILVGYTAYIELIKPIFPHKKTFDTTMKKEIERCKIALELAQKGENVAVICSGDAGVYGMSGLIFELSAEFPEVEIEVISGVTAALSGGALLGAPLTHDFAVISLSDLLTPWELIKKRLKFTAMADFCVVLYNPSSKKRCDYLKKSCEILLEFKSPETVCGIAKNIGREGENTEILTLSELQNTAVDMFTTVFIGNSQTKIINGKMVTPRGYEI
jgi:precorrin-3B C17-methyltransferase